MYTVRQLAELAGVTVRTLHHYDEIGLLKPTRIGQNGYRHYDETAVMRLQQILFYRELGMELAAIREILDSPDFDAIRALQTHRQLLEARSARLQRLIETIDSTIQHLRGETTMSRKKMFEGFTPEQEEENTRLARLQYDPKIVNDSSRRWKSYSPAQRQAILEEGSQIYTDLAEALESGIPAVDARVQAILVRWHNHLYNFYEPTLEILRGLGELYNTDPAFIANFQALHNDLPEFLHTGIEQYVDALETSALEQMLAEDDDNRRTGSSS
jgi:DNA-binding transcriptional MerR regulator